MLAIRSKTSGRLAQIMINKEIRHYPYEDGGSPYAEIYIYDSQYPGIVFMVDNELRETLSELLKSGESEYGFNVPVSIWSQNGCPGSYEDQFEIVELDI